MPEYPLLMPVSRQVLQLVILRVPQSINGAFAVPAGLCAVAMGKFMGKTL